MNTYIYNKYVCTYIISITMLSGRCHMYNIDNDYCHIYIRLGASTDPNNTAYTVTNLSTPISP